MPEWASYLEEARARGSLADEVYQVVSEPVGDMDLVAKARPDHLTYMKSLEASGALMLAGPLSSEDGTRLEGVGMLILRADSLEAARALADGDPMHSSGARRYTLRRWMINEGGFTLKVQFAAQSARFG